MKVVGIIQARMGSSRLPGKMLMDLAGQPIIAWVIERVKHARLIDEVWLATSDTPPDDQLAAWAQGQGIAVYRGSEHDVLDRFYQTALVAGAEAVVRITGDCPLIDPTVIDKVIGVFNEGGSEYVSNVHPPTYPDGLDVEVFSFAALRRAAQEASDPAEREHVTVYIEDQNRFRIRNVAHHTDLSKFRFTLDTSEDLNFLRLLLPEALKNTTSPRLEDFMKVLEDHPEWLAINSSHSRNEAYVPPVTG